MHADQRFRVRSVELSLDERQVLPPVEHAVVGDDPEVAVTGGQSGFGQPLHDAGSPQPVGDELGGRDEPQPVPLRELGQLGAPGHGTVFVEYLADHSDRSKPGRLGEIHGRLGLAHAPQHPAGLGNYWEDVARAPQVLGAGLGIDQE